MNPAHLDYDTLADLAEGLLDDDRAASVTAHLDTCAVCRERSDELHDVSRILAEAPVPSMPADLASRIDSAIAAESMHNAAVVSLEQRRGRRHWRFLSAAAAAVVVVGGGGLVGYQLLGGSDGSSQTAASTPVQDPPDRRSHPPDPGALGTAPAPHAEGGSGYTVLRSGTNYRAGTLARQITGLVGNGGRQFTLSGGEPNGRITECVGRVAQGKVPKVVDEATYEGAPATVIALPSEASGGLDVWVVGPKCSSRDPDLITHQQIER